MERVKIINKTSENSILKLEWLQLLVEFHLYVSNAKNPKIIKYIFDIGQQFRSSI